MEPITTFEFAEMMLGRKLEPYQKEQLSRLTYAPRAFLHRLGEFKQHIMREALLLCYADAMVKRPKRKLRGWKNKERAWGKK